MVVTLVYSLCSIKKNERMRHLITLLFISLFSLKGYAQSGTVEGKIIDARTGQSLSGVSVLVVGAQNGVITDQDGHFVFTMDAETPHTIRISSVGYNTKEIEKIEVDAGKVLTLNAVMDVAMKTEQEIVIKTSRQKETTAALISYQKNTNAVASVISSESIKRSPDKNTSDALKRVPGLSIQEGRYLVVRGLSDRYNQAMLNGVLLSSTEPDRKTFSFDIFPAAIIENIVINKTFIPEYSAEWAGGLIQINTKDIPSKGFLNVQVGTNSNTNTIGRDFYTYPGGKLDWLGFDDGSRALPDDLPTKSNFNALPDAVKTGWGKKIAADQWSINKQNAPLNALGQSFQINSGFSTRLFKKNFGGVITATYDRTVKAIDYENSFYSIENSKASQNFNYYNTKYSTDVLWGAMANFSIKLNDNNKISLKNLFNVHSFDMTTLRSGKDYEANSQLGENIRARELNFTNNTFFNTILSGEHNISSIHSKLNWFGSFNILDQYIPLQRRLQYNQDPTIENAPYLALISNSLSQKSGSIFYSNLSDYIYSAGGDITTTYKLFSSKQTLKGGYVFQVKDRLYDARPFSINLPSNNPALKELDEDHIFAPENFGIADNQFHFDALYGNQYRYMANTILNAGYIQSDNSFNNWLRIVWGGRYEYFDQLIGSVKTSDDRFVYTKKGDFLPALNITFKLKHNTNIRIAGSQTLVRPEFRELSNLAFYDFEIGATITGNKDLVRTKISNLDFRYEIYPRSGEVFTAGVFYKYFNSPVELQFNQSGAGSSNTFNYTNANSATSYGAEVEFRKRLDFVSGGLKNFTAQGNFSYIYNRVKFGNSQLDRPMQGQSPYLINVGLLYDAEKIGLNTTLLFNEAGRRILYVGNDEIPAIWEAPRPLLDLQIAKKIIKQKGELRLNLSDLLNQRAYFYHDLDNDKRYTPDSDALALTRKYGTNISLTFNYIIK